MAWDGAKSRHMIKLFAGLAKRVIEQGAIVAFEWPANCHCWKEGCVMELRRPLPYECGFDGCAYGLVDERTGKHMRKPWNVITHHQPLQKFLHLRCLGNHVHLDGREFNCRNFRKTGLYTTALCRAVLWRA